jgi:hypothetical protein
VRFSPPGASAKERRRYLFRTSRRYVFLGEIQNMPGHCIVVDLKTGRVFSGWHTENFEELPADDV